MIGSPHPWNHISLSLGHNADSQGKGHTHQKGQWCNQKGSKHKPDGDGKEQCMLKNYRYQALVQDQEDADARDNPFEIED